MEVAECVLKNKFYTSQVDFKNTDLWPKLYTWNLAIFSMCKCHHFQSFSIISLLFPMKFFCWPTVNYFFFESSTACVLNCQNKAPSASTHLHQPRSQLRKSYATLNLHFPSWKRSLPVSRYTCLYKLELT